MTDRPRAILIAGPTASGKSALALALARLFGGVVINADAMQVYRELRLITARPGPDEEAAAPHRLYGAVPAAERFSTGRWLEAAGAEIAAAEAAGRMPILAGGTGLYFKALTEGLADIPAVPEALARDWRAEAERVGAPLLHAILARRDPETAALVEASDTQRIVRALSVLEATGRGLAEYHGGPAKPPLLALTECRAVFLDAERDWLRARIDARFDVMMRAGALDEVRGLMALGLDPSLPAMRAHGVPHLAAHLAGRIDLATAIARAKGDTRRYAKRQRTWFRHQMPGWESLAVGPETELEALVAAVQPRSARAPISLSRV